MFLATVTPAFMRAVHQYGHGETTDNSAMNKCEPGGVKC
jgi:hypothetical protein